MTLYRCNDYRTVVKSRLTGLCRKVVYGYVIHRHRVWVYFVQSVSVGYFTGIRNTEIPTVSLLYE